MTHVYVDALAGEASARQLESPAEVWELLESWALRDSRFKGP